MVTKLIKLKDVAKEAGISVSTVSRVINHEKFVSKKVKIKVEKAVKKLNYQPQWIARSLRTKKTNIVGLIVASIEDYWMSSVAQNIENYFRIIKKNIILFNTGFNQKLEIELLNLAISRGVDGIILGTVSKSGDCINEIINKNNIPIIIIDNKIDVDKADFILVDDIDGSYRLVNHLIKEHGLKKIACIGGNLQESSGADKVLGYKKALNENDIEINEDIIKEAFWNSNISYKVTRELFTKKEKPEAIFCSNATMAIGTVRYLNEKGIRIPDDVAVVSFDDSEFIKAFNPPLTTLARVERKVGIKAAELLESRMTGEFRANFKTIKISPNIIIRKSCGCKKN